MSLDLEALQTFPKISLHDHLDGGLRPQTIIAAGLRDGMAKTRSSSARAAIHAPSAPKATPMAARRIA